MDRGGVSCSLSFCGIMKKSIIEVFEGVGMAEIFHFSVLKDVSWSYLDSYEGERYEYIPVLCLLAKI